MTGQLVSDVSRLTAFGTFDVTGNPVEDFAGEPGPQSIQEDGS